MKRQKVFVCAAVIAIVVLLGALALALYALGKCPRHCEFPGFCEELLIAQAHPDESHAEPVVLERDIACPYDATLKLSVKLYWDASGRVRAVHEKKYKDGRDSGEFTFGNLSANNPRVLTNASSSLTPSLEYVSRSQSCGQHDFLFYMIPASELSADGKLAVKVGIGFSEGLFTRNIFWRSPSGWGNAFANLRYAFRNPRYDVAPDGSRLATLKLIIVEWMESSPDFRQLKGYPQHVDEIMSVADLNWFRPWEARIGKHWRYEVERSRLVGFYEDPDDPAWYYYVVIDIQNDKVVKSEISRPVVRKNGQGTRG